jgi:hypothetical protein
MGRPKIAYRLKGLYAVGGKILYGGERFYYGRFTLIVIGSQLIIQGRAKILQSIVMVLCSREVVYGCERYSAWSNEPSLQVMNCLIAVGRSQLGNKLSAVVQGRSLCSLLLGAQPVNLGVHNIIGENNYALAA